MTRLAIVGNGVATGRLLDDLERRGLDRFAIPVFGEEPRGCYNRVLLGRVLGTGDAESITTKPAGWYAERGVAFHSGVTVTSLDAASKWLEASDGSRHEFDAAVIATGSAPFVPDVMGLRGPGGAFKRGVHAYRTVGDCERIRADVSPGTTAVVVGGGLLGLEAAKVLADLGAAVTVVHRPAGLMNAQFDAAGSRLLGRAFEKLGVRVVTGTSPEELLGTAAVAAVRLASGEVIEAGVVVFACGIRPRAELTRAAGLAVRSGVVVSDSLETSAPGVYALGECAEHAGRVYGIVRPIYEQSAVLADILSGADPHARYRGSKLYTRLKVAGVEVASLGIVDAETDADEVVEVSELRRGVYRKLVVRDGRLVGAVLVGDASAAPALVRLLDRGDPLPANRLNVLASGDAIPGGESTSDPEVCNCHRVRTGAILEAVRGGCDDLAKLASATRAGTGCGPCRGQLADLILRNAPAPAGRKG